MREDSWNASGWANWKVGEKSSSAAWRWIAATIGGPVVAGVAAPQRRGRVENLTPLGGVIVHVLRCEISRGRFLNARLGVNGSQNAARSLGIRRARRRWTSVFSSGVIDFLNNAPGQCDLSSCRDVSVVLNTERMNSSARELDLGARLRALRLRGGLSQRELARRARVSNATISMIEADRVSPSVSALRQILAPLGVGIGDFFSAPEPPGEQVVFRADELTEISPAARFPIARSGPISGDARCK